MAFSPSPKVQVARDFARKFGHKQVVIVALNQDTGKIEGVSYGETKELCAATKPLMDAAYDAIVEHLSTEATG